MREQVDLANRANRTPEKTPPDFSAQALAGVVRDRLPGQARAGSVSYSPRPFAMKPPDAGLAEACKAFKGCLSGAALAALLGMERQSMSRVQAGRNALGLIPVLETDED